MGAYLDKLTADMKAAMRAGEKDKLTVIRMIISDIKKKAEVDGELSDEAEAAILQKAVKTRLDTV
ncbi:MAG: GatB/YqeY domain-containing protein, partial [Planctomycetes bacterium]|nr:GatB/YqeY domain-containing protein [Planctomycetota bacterium]